ncbi:1-phosphatidylinositol-3-phosphate 5-kinase FAB1B [Bienertia sinuspersici]
MNQDLTPNIDEPEPSLYDIGSTDVENVDFENNGLLWIPPEPEDEDDDREADLFDDEDDGDAAGEWGYQSSTSSFGGGELQQREKANEEHRKAMRNVVGGHFRALITQLLQVENLPFHEGYDKESWLDIITSLSWEAASLLKPDMTKGSGMDPGGYVKVKCLACGKRSDSAVVKGVVCKKNVAHRRMTAKFDRPRLLILGGALEYQRVSNHLSSFDTLLQQEMDHLMMTVAKISAHNPNILLVEKSVSRFAQEYLLKKNISLALNIKRPLLERIARCTGAQIVPSVDHLKSQNLGYCDSFRVEKYFEEHGSAGQGGKKLTKTLMFFEGCPKPLGCTYGIFAAYHLALETSYLADEGASLPELPLNSPITVALPDKPLNINRSISTVPDLVTPTTERPQSENSHLMSQVPSLMLTNTAPMSERCQTSSLTKFIESSSSSVHSSIDDSSCSSLHEVPNSMCNDLSQSGIFERISKLDVNQFPESQSTTMKPDEVLHDDYVTASSFNTSSSIGHNACKSNDDDNALTELDSNNPGNMSEPNYREQNEKVQPVKEEFSPLPADGQSILVSLTTRCVWKGVVCERAHLFRIKYYRNFDKPLGRFLLDDLFDQFRCRVCEMPSEAHIHCYTHQQGSLTISVRKLTEFPLPGEREGKIWMWHRCLRCPRTNGFPPATRRIAMSDAAWGFLLENSWNSAFQTMQLLVELLVVAILFTRIA